METSALHERVAQRLVQANRRVVFAESCTAGLISALLASTAGISQYLCGSAVTYREDTKSSWLGVLGDVLREYSPVSLAVAEGMAMGVLRRTPEADIALSVTGHLGPKAPPHQDGLIYVGTAARIAQLKNVLPLGVYEYRLASVDRIERQHEAAECVLRRLEGLLTAALPTDENASPPTLAEIDQAVVRMGGRWFAQPLDHPARPRPAAIFPGAFHPLHAGHQGIADTAERRLGIRPQFEISVENVDKAPLSAQDIDLRVKQFPLDETVWLTRAATFLEKARLFPATTFLVGADTILRIAAPVYYNGDAEQRNRAVDEIAQLGCRFLVYGRLLGERFTTLDELDLPGKLGKLCRGVPCGEFREDVTSTDLRRKAEQHAGEAIEPI